MTTLTDEEIRFLLNRMALDDEGYNVRTIAVFDNPDNIAFEDSATGVPFDVDTVRRIHKAARERMYHCYSCGEDKHISEWTHDSHGVNLCADCMVEAEWENAHSDYDHEHAPDPNCPLCRDETSNS